MSDQNDQINRLLTAGISDHQQGRLKEAARQYAEVLTLSPEQPDALHLTGLLAFQNGELEKAKALIETAIKFNSGDARYWANLGRVHTAIGDHQSAVTAWLQVLDLDLGAVDVHSDLAGAYYLLQSFDLALLHADKALLLDPEYPNAHLNKGLALAGLEQWQKAITSLKTAATYMPDNSDIWFQLGQFSQQQGDVLLAETAYEKALALAPELVEALNNLANLMRDEMRFDEAVNRYQAALGIDPHRGDIHSNLGVTLQEMGFTERAIACYRAAINLNAENAEAHRNLGMALLQSGAFEEGWKEYEWRWKTRHFATVVRDWGKPRWQGEDISNKTVLVHCEQGFGDCLQFARYLPMVAKKAQKLIVETPEALAGLFARMEGRFEVVVAGSPVPAFDMQVALLSLPSVFNTKLNNIPDKIPYVMEPPQKAAVWRKRLAKTTDEVLVGLAWKGSGTHQRNQLRSPGLKVLEFLLETGLPLRFVSLQKEDGAADIRSMHLNEKIEDYTSDLISFDDTAALVSCLDVVVAPDTAVVHLAGALGVPTLLMLPAVSEWRWMVKRNDSPWYPNTSLFRQKNIGDWEQVIQLIRQNLEKYLNT